MIPLRDNQIRTAAPFVNWTLVALNVLIYVWDRQGTVFGSSVTFADLAMRPREVVSAVFERTDYFPIVTVFTSMFLHGDLLHLIGNLIFLVVFGSAVEEALGSWRYALYYLFWGVMAAAAQIYVDPASVVPTLGASGAIGGVLGAYFLLFPSNKIEMIVPWLPFWKPVVSAWVLLGLWFLWQILVPREGVANWAHAGGFLAGMTTVLILGGRDAILKPDRETAW
ncbi:MAG TPA: rhomboid family intramembrane serine protease [Fimbriimonas sp.]